MKKIAITNFFIHLFLVLCCLLCIVPLLLVLSISFTPEILIAENGYQLIPKRFSLDAYRFIISGTYSLWNSYAVSIFVTVVGTFLSLAVTSMLAYPLSRRDVKYRNGVSFYLFFTMLFNGGLVANYILMTQYLHLKDNIFVLILPMMINAWNVLLMRNFFKDIPFSVIESAKMDGAGEFRVFLSIIVPMSTPTFATVGMFIALAYWNDWWLALMYITDRKIQPLQYTLQAILLNIQVLLSDVQLQKSMDGEIPSEAARMALCVLAVGPIILVYPFIQKYIVKGMTVGAVKG